MTTNDTDQNITEKIETLREYVETLGLGSESGIEIEPIFCRVEEDGETWPVGDWEVEDLIEEGEEIVTEMTVCGWSEDKHSDAPMHNGMEKLRNEIERLGLTIESESDGFRSRMENGKPVTTEEKNFMVKGTSAKKK